MITLFLSIFVLFVKAKKNNCVSENETITWRLVYAPVLTAKEIVINLRATQSFNVAISEQKVQIISEKS